MKKIILSLSMLVAVGAVVFSATSAFFSDTETSTGNVFTAGAIDLGVDNESYYNNRPNLGTSWTLDWDIDNTEYLGDNPNTPELETDYPLSIPRPRQFFNFLDLKPGDSGEDTISLHVNNNDSWLCADITLTKNDDVSSNEPEMDAGDALEAVNMWDGELANHLKWYWWADDGDNVYECVMHDHDQNELTPNVCNPNAAGTENLLAGSGNAFPNPVVGPYTSTVDLADADTNIWTGSGPLPGGDTRYIGKAWCFGTSPFAAYAQDGLGATGTNGPDDGRGVVCDGSLETNITQTDSMMMDVSFRAVQSRNNPAFECEPLLAQ